MFGQNTNLKIKTKNGWEHFYGVQKLSDRLTVSIILDNEQTLTCTKNHKLKTPFGFVELDRLYEGDVVETETGNATILRIVPNCKTEDVYDVIDAGLDKSYYTNGILSHNCEFIGSTNTLIHPSKLRTLVFKNSIYQDGFLDVYEHALPNKTYCMTVDVAEGQGLDYSTFSVFDVTQIPYVQVAKYRNNKITPLLFPTVILQAARKYNDAFVLVEINSIGLQVADILHFELAYENLVKIQVKGKQGQMSTPGFTRKIAYGLRQSSQTKNIGCANIKALIESDKLIINDSDTIMELMTFSADKNTFKAEEGNTDDLAMTLVNFGWLTSQRYFKENVNNDIRQVLQQEQMNLMDQDIVPFGAINNGIDDPFDDNRDANGDLWVEDRMKLYPFDNLSFDWRQKL